MPGKIKLTEKCDTIIKYLKDHHPKMSARKIHAEIAEFGVSYSSVAACLVEYRRRGGQLSPKRGKTRMGLGKSGKSEKRQKSGKSERIGKNRRNGKSEKNQVKLKKLKNRNRFPLFRHFLIFPFFLFPRFFLFS